MSFSSSRLWFLTSAIVFSSKLSNGWLNIGNCLNVKLKSSDDSVEVSLKWKFKVTQLKNKFADILERKRRVKKNLNLNLKISKKSLLKFQCKIEFIMFHRFLKTKSLRLRGTIIQRNDGFSKKTPQFAKDKATYWYEMFRNYFNKLLRRLIEVTLSWELQKLALGLPPNRSLPKNDHYRLLVTVL
jgi:hypothetical protein